MAIVARRVSFSILAHNTLLSRKAIGYLSIAASAPYLVTWSNRFKVKFLGKSEG